MTTTPARNTHWRQPLPKENWSSPIVIPFHLQNPTAAATGFPTNAPPSLPSEITTDEIVDGWEHPGLLIAPCPLRLDRVLFQCSVCVEATELNSVFLLLMRWPSTSDEYQTGTSTWNNVVAWAPFTDYGQSGGSLGTPLPSPTSDPWFIRRAGSYTAVAPSLIFEMFIDPRGQNLLREGDDLYLMLASTTLDNDLTTLDKFRLTMVFHPAS